MTQANRKFLAHYKVWELSHCVAQLESGVARNVIGIPDDVTVTAAEINAEISHRLAIKNAALAKLDVYDMLQAVHDEAYREGERNALDEIDFSKGPEFTFEDYVAEIERRINS